ncbi:MAG: flagellar hook-basal body complex protein FliE [Roseiarcus sp.]|jgi:flagellar hook-basal body complex protein FliE|uniref:flagellar hook-basal body complex protein FliE n=1 Tax=Roseiarcus sp. TaxID=1969460 RepID=UPI003BB10891
MIEGVSALGMLSSGSSVGAPTAPAAPAVGASFEQALGQAIGSAVDTLKAGEAFAIQGVQGAATPMKVVESVMDAQRSLQSVLAIRDKIVSAYQEIARMAI